MARRLATYCHQVGITAPGYRSPPSEPGVSRALKRYPDGSVVVSIALRGRSRDEVLADMIDGVIVANGLRSGRAENLRTTLHWVVTSRMTSAA